MSWVTFIINHTKICVYVKAYPLSGQKGKRAEPPKVRAGQKQEVSEFSCHLLLDLCRFLRMGVSRDAEHYGEGKNVVTSCFARQIASASIALPVIDWFMPFSQYGVSQDAEHCGEVENVVTSWHACQTGSASRAKQEVKTFTTSPFCSVSQETSIQRKRHESINYKQENADTSCLASKTGSDHIFDFTVVFRTPRHPYPEKTA